RIDRRAAGQARLGTWIERHTRQDDHRRFAEVLGEMAGRGEHLARGAVCRLLRRPRVVRRLHQLTPGLAIELAELGALGPVSHHDETPVLTIAAARRADGGVHDLLQYVVGDRVRLEASHRALRGHDIEEVHVPSRIYSKPYRREPCPTTSA